MNVSSIVVSRLGVIPAEPFLLVEPSGLEYRFSVRLFRLYKRQQQPAAIGGPR
jgi:hypothetical protein